jgi:alkylhydroperoxidase family enzyme
MNDRYAEFRNATASALLRGAGATSAELRQAVAAGRAPADLVTLVEKVRSRAWSVTDLDIDALRALYTEEQLFEIIVSAAFGAADERLQAALRAMEGA